MKKKKISPNRSVVVFSTLVGVLSLTSVILLLLAPAPLTPGAAESLFAVDTPDELASIFQTRKPLANWQYIYIHQSGPESPASVSGDHFVVCNGSEQGDGELQIGQRWLDQTPGAPPAGARSLGSSCIAICVQGNFDQTVPTPTQLRRLSELTVALQSRLHIAADHIIFVDRAPQAAGIGKYFPVAAFRQRAAAGG